MIGVGDDEPAASGGEQAPGAAASPEIPRLQAMRTRAEAAHEETAPLALVDGEPVTELPQDLYIPPDALEVFLEAFEGPLDLLLYLIRRQNVDILDIRVAEITAQYMHYVELMQALQLELAAEYLVMAAVLAEIKSRMLLPRPEPESEEEAGDPRAELIRRLQVYERFKTAAEDIDALPRVERDIQLASATAPPKDSHQPLPRVDMRELLAALGEVMHRAELYKHHEVKLEALSTRERMAEVLRRVSGTADFVAFHTLFPVDEGREGVVVTFLALMELMKESLIEIVQAEAFAPIHVRAPRRS